MIELELIACFFLCINCFVVSAHGKTSFVDNLVEETHVELFKPEGEGLRFTDTLFIEQERQLSIKATPLTLVLGDSRQKNFLVNVVDTPGHVNFADEVSASLFILIK